MNTQRELVETYFKDDKLVLRPYTVWRYTQGDGRIYYSFDFAPQEDGTPVFFISLTTLTKETLPTPMSLQKWRCDLGWEKSKIYAKERADYGTMMHTLLGMLMKNNTLDKREVEEMVNKGAPSHVDKMEWIDELWRDCQAFQQFVIEYDVVPLAIEIVLCSKEGYATLIDLVCEMNDEVEGYFGEVYERGSAKNKKGSPKKSKKIVRINGLINFKSGRKGFHEENEIQLEFERRLFKENFPDVKIDKIFNWAPKDWKTEPTFNLTDQSDSLEVEMFEPLLKIAKIKLFKRTPYVKLSSGKLIFKITDPISLNSSMPLKMFLKNMHTEPELPEPTEGNQFEKL